MRSKLITSESVTEGHPDKVADRISDAVLDAVLAQDPQGRVACETFVMQGLVLVGGEIATEATIQPERIARRVIEEVGYTDPDFGLSHEACAVVSALRQQSPDIAQAVLQAAESRAGSSDHYDHIGAGDQGIMFGYATCETPEYMPLPIVMAHKLARRLAEVRKDGSLPYLRPDGKTQVTVTYEGKRPVRVHTVLIAAQHAPEVELGDLAADIRRLVVEPVLDGWLDEETKVLVNTSGRFVVGGPASDTGMTGRKIIVDTYGGYGSHGGGAFSGKDPTKVDRSGSYMARYVAKNVVAAGLAKECEIQVAYAIGRARPLALNVETFGTGIISDDDLREIVLEVFDFRPAAIIDHLQLRRPIYEPFSCYGHFGRLELSPPWEATDRVEELRRKAAERSRKLV
ncbi:MAG: S-adenosylmethionine synthase [Acetothermia bacterium 64_32]|nr:MAG: S-adenosylmethionine synthase [Acetothermia bacterium 64_32]HAF70114.1 methionine adenosyltransferase [Candidatus Acetothermia bacterium]